VRQYIGWASCDGRPGKDRWAVFCGDWTLEEQQKLASARKHFDGDHAAGELMPVRLAVPQREGVRLIVRDQEGRILMQHRSADTNPGMWTPPGGAIKPGEDPYDAALRELVEEAGLDLKTLTPPIPVGDICFTAPDDGAWVRHHVYTSTTTASEHDLRLGEGQALRFLDWSELDQLELSPSGRVALAIAWLAAPAPQTG
jgi:8-oxo-dGTP pyrophosphatase MutT (NUDIX family)